jgi:hypothetical protein
MPQVCTVCSHPRVKEINKRLVVPHASITKISEEYGLNYNALYRHQKNHVPKQLLKLYEQKELSTNFDLMTEIDFLITETRDIYNEARKGDKNLLALKSLDSLRNHYGLLVQIAAQLHSQKMLELELAKIKNEEGQDVISKEYSQKLKRLTFEELREFNRLIRKIWDDTTEEIN